MSKRKYIPVICLEVIKTNAENKLSPDGAKIAVHWANIAIAQCHKILTLVSKLQGFEV